MVTQEELCKNEFAEFALYEFPDEGELHTLNVPETEEQRRTVTDRGRNFDYTIQTRLVTCIHGMLDESSKKPASLIVFEYKVKFKQEGRAFSTIRTSFTFTLSKDFDSHEPAPAPGYGPEVIAYAPFRNYERYNETTAKEKKKVGGDGEIGTPSFLPLQGKIGGNFSSSSAWTQRYFNEGFASIRHDEERNLDNGVEWYMHHNKRQNHGVSPVFRVAVLLKRENDDLFFGHFLIKVKGGFRFAVAEGIKSLVATLDDPIRFNPKREPLWNESQSFDPKATGVDPNNLGKKAEGDNLIGLTWVWGLEPLKEPTSE